jgi:hypothetical protein
MMNWNETLMAHFWVLFQNFYGGIAENYKKPQESWLPGQDLDLRLPGTK